MDGICLLYTEEFNSDFFNYSNSNGPPDIIQLLAEICKLTPILNSNIDSIYNELVVNPRKIYNLYLDLQSL